MEWRMELLHWANSETIAVAVHAMAHPHTARHCMASTDQLAIKTSSCQQSLPETKQAKLQPWISKLDSMTG